MKPQSNEQLKFVVPVLVALALGFLWQYALSGSPTKIDTSFLLSSGAAYLPLITQGEWWRLFFAPFLHSGILALSINCICLFRIGGIAEKVFGVARCLVIFIVAAAVGNLLSLYCYPLTPAVGATGAIAGLFGALWGAILSEPQRVPQFKKDPLTIGLFLGMNLLAIRNGSLLAMSLGGFVTGFLMANFGYSAFLARMDVVIAKRERVIFLFSLVMILFAIFDLPKIPNIAGILHSNAELATQTRQKMADLNSFYANQENKKMEFIQHELIDPWLKKEAELSELKLTLGVWMDTPSVAREVELASQSAAANVIAFQSLLLFARQQSQEQGLKSNVESGGISLAELLSAHTKTLFPELKRARAELKNLHNDAHLESTDSVIVFAERQEQAWEKEMVASYVKALTQEQSQMDKFKLEQFAKLFEPKSSSEKSISAALKFANEEMRDACLLSKQLHSDLEQFSLFSESEMLNLVESCELNNALARATAMDALVRLRFDFLFERVANRKIDREQSLQFIEKLISTLLAPDFTGDTARLPASGSEQVDAEFEKIKNIQISRRESITTLVEGIKAGNAGDIMRAGALWKAADRVADLELRAKTLGPKENY